MAIRERSWAKGFAQHLSEISECSHNTYVLGAFIWLDATSDQGGLYAGAKRTTPAFGLGEPPCGGCRGADLFGGASLRPIRRLERGKRFVRLRHIERE